jgi:hypothetical protein
MAITINGTGSITGLTAGGLPDGSITTDDLAANAVTAAKLAAGAGGKILQVVQGTTATPVTTNTSTATDIGLSASIQPVAANSNIIAIVNASCRIWGGLYQNIGFSLLRGSTKIWGDNGSVSSNQYYFETGGNQYRYFYAALNYQDDPTYTLGDTLTYKVQSRQSGSYDVRWQYENHQSTILLLEVAQ